MSARGTPSATLAISSICFRIARCGWNTKWAMNATNMPFFRIQMRTKMSKKLTPEEARRITDELKRHEEIIERELQTVRIALRKTAGALANIANGRDLDDPVFRAEVAARINAPRYIEMAINIIKGNAPNNEELLDYCLSLMESELGVGDE